MAVLGTKEGMNMGYSKTILRLICLALFLFPGFLRADEKPDIFVQAGHAGPVVSVAFSPDGRFALSGSEDKTLKLWDIKTGKEIRTFRGHGGPVTHVAFTADGKFALSGSLPVSFSSYFNLKNEFAAAGLTWGDAMSEKAWDIASGKETSLDHVSPVDISRFRQLSHGGKLDLFTYPSNEAQRYKLNDGDVALYDIGNNKVIRIFKGHKATVDQMRFSPDGKYAASGSRDKTLRLWDIATGKEIGTFGHTDWVRCLSFSPDGKSIASGGSDRAIKLWDIQTGKVTRTFAGNQQVFSVAFSPDGKKILSGGYDNMLQMWDVATGQEVMTFKGEVAKDSIAIYSPEGKYFLSGGIGVPLKLWDVATVAKVRTYEGQPPPAAFSPDGKSILSYNWKNLKLLETATGREIKTYEKLNINWGDTIKISPDGKYLLAGTGKTLKLLDVVSGEEITALPGHAKNINSVAFSPDGKYALSSADYDNAVKLWDIGAGKESGTFAGHLTAVWSVAFSADGRFALAGGEANGAGMATLWDIATGKEIGTFIGHTTYVFSAAISPDGKFVLTASLDHTLKLWDVSTGKEIRTFRGHFGNIRSVSFSPDGRFALSAGSDDGTKRIWDIATGEELVKMVDFSDGEWIAITPEGYFNASPKGTKHLNVSIGTNVYGIENFYEKFFNPVYVASVLLGKKVEVLADIRKGIMTPPAVLITSPKPNETINNDSISVTVTAKDTGGGIDEIRLYHNGKAVGEDARAVKIVSKGPEAAKTYAVTLVEGMNTFRAVGFSKDRTESNPYELAVHLSAPQKDSSMHVLAVGINKYRNPALNLNYAVPDAKGIIDFFQAQGTGLFEKVNVADAYDENATKTNITAKLKGLENTKPQDVVLIYLAGHGENISDKWYFIPYELAYPEREDDVKSKGISSDELAGLIRNIRAQKVLVMIDSCKAGAMLIAMRGFEDRKALSQLSRSTGVHVIAASTKDQFAAEVEELGHGVFTYTLLEGLKGQASTGNDKIVTVRKLMTHVENRLPDITMKYRKEAQFPVVDSRGMDFPLVVVK